MVVIVLTLVISDTTDFQMWREDLCRPVPDGSSELGQSMAILGGIF